MNRGLIVFLVAGGLAFAGGRHKTVALTVASPWGVPPTAMTEGVPVTNVSYVACSVHGIDSTVSSGSVCWYRNPNEYTGTTSALDGDAGWEHIGDARQTAGYVQNPDGGALRRYSFQALKVGIQYGRMLCVACPLTGTADDAGMARFQVRTEAWVP